MFEKKQGRLRESERDREMESNLESQTDRDRRVEQKKGFVSGRQILSQLSLVMRKMRRIKMKGTGWTV